MSWAVSLTTETQETQLLATYQYDLQVITNAMLALTRESAAVYEEQDAAMKAYIDAHQQDAEGVIDTATFDYVNSAAFTLPFERKLNEIKVKEQSLQQEKVQVETRIKEIQTNLESVEKLESKNAENIFGYMK